jgi:hypothetical protein
MIKIGLAGFKTIEVTDRCAEDIFKIMRIGSQRNELGYGTLTPGTIRAGTFRAINGAKKSIISSNIIKIMRVLNKMGEQATLSDQNLYWI